MRFEVPRTTALGKARRDGYRHLVRDVYAPSDALPGAPFWLGGRVVGVDRDGRRPSSLMLVVADAFALRRVHIRGGGGGAIVIGDLILTEIAHVDADGALSAAIVEVVGSDVRGDGAEGPMVARAGGVIDRARALGGGEHSRLASARRAENLRNRAVLLRAVRRFFDERGYLEVETPSVVPSPGLDVHLDAFEVSGADHAHAQRHHFLITSPEYQMKRLLAAGMPRLYQIGRCFRPGEIGTRHNPEFTMLEWYRAFSSVEEIIEETEALVVALATAAPGHGRPELIVGGRTIALDPPFERLPICEAFARHAEISAQEALTLALSERDDDETRFFRLLVDRVEPALANGPPVFLVDYPVTQASLARRRDDDPRLAERFELYVGGVELCNGFGELVDPVEQRTRLEGDQRTRARLGRPVYPIDERFLTALEEGIPPSSGNALGLDRLLALALGAATIGDVQAFPEGWL